MLNCVSVSIFISHVKDTNAWLFLKYTFILFAAAVLFLPENAVCGVLQETIEYKLSNFQRTTNLTQHYFSKIARLKSCGADRVRTDDPLLAKQALSQLSYSPLKQVAVGPEGIEPSTSRLSSVRSNQLSYEPKLFSK